MQSRAKNLRVVQNLAGVNEGLKNFEHRSFEDLAPKLGVR